MKIEYKILWFEDQFDQMSATHESLRDLLDEHGFDLKVDLKDVVTLELVNQISNALKNYNPYDLILFDYGLGEGAANGVDIAKRLRTHLYSDMIFYSAKSRSDLRDLLYSNNIDGVFTAGRRSFPEDVEPIISDQIKRICDVNMMRGIVMDEVSRFDRQLRQLSVDIHNLERVDNAVALKKLSKRFKNKEKEFAKLAAKVDCPIDAYSSEKLTSFEFVKSGLVDVLDLVEGSSLKDALDEKGVIRELQQLRNRLAHVEADFDGEGKMLLKDGKCNGFDFERFVAIRTDLRKASAVITETMNSLP